MTVAKNLRAALVTSILSIASGLSTSALIFTGPIQQFVGFGLSAALITATLSALITSGGSGFGIAIGSPSSAIAAALAVTVATLDPFLESIPSARAIALVLALIALTTIATGLLLFLLGVGRLGRIVRFIPFPVVAGFMGTTGLLLVAGAIRLTTQMPLSLSTMPELLQPSQLGGLCLIGLWGAVLMMMSKRFKSPVTIPALFVAAVLGVDLAVAFAPTPGIQDFLSRSMFHAEAHSAFMLPMVAAAFSPDDWQFILPLIPNILAIVFIAVLTALLTFTGLEAALDVDGDLDRELRVQGVANIASALSGGYVGLISIGTTLAGKAAGATGRLAGVLTGLVCAALLLDGQTLVNEVPRFIVGGLQLQIGVQLLWTWCVASRKRMPLFEWLLVIGIIIVAAWFGFVPAVLCGIVGGCIIFAVDVSRIDVVRRVYSINERSSPLVRSAEELAILVRMGKAAKVVELNSYIFFGSAYKLLSQIRSLVRSEPVRLIVLDFTAVTRVDSSATSVLARLEGLMRPYAVRLAYAGIQREILSILTSSGAISQSASIMADRNTALEFAEHVILTESGLPSPSETSLTSWLTQSLGRRDLADVLVPMLEGEDVPVGTYLCRQGEPTDSLIFIESGRVGVMIASDGREVCVRVFGPRTIAGEQGFILAQPRSASLKVEERARIWSLARSTYDELLVTHSELVIALIGDIVRVQSERLSFATRSNTVMAG